MNTRDFYESISFSSIQTWSFHREPNLRSYLNRKTEEIAQTETTLSKARYMELPALLEKISRLKREKEMFGIGLFDSEGKINESAYDLAILFRGCETEEELRRIFSLPVMEEIASGCIPLYRDALIFHDEKGNTIRVLDICFECHFLKTDDGLFLKADHSFYLKLAAFLRTLGHNIA